MNRTAAAATAVALVAAAGLAGAANGPQRPSTALWYAILRKPPLNPPGPVVGAAWGVLELLLIGAGYRLLRARGSHERTASLRAWGLNLAGLAGYPYLFFGEKRLASSAAASAAMLGSAGALVMEARKVDLPAAAMSAPLVAWLAFATFLSEELWRRNPRLARD